MQTFYREVLPGKGFLWGLLFDKMGFGILGGNILEVQKKVRIVIVLSVFFTKKKACKKVFGPRTK